MDRIRVRQVVPTSGTRRFGIAAEEVPAGWMEEFWTRGRTKIEVTKTTSSNTEKTAALKTVAVMPAVETTCSGVDQYATHAPMPVQRIAIEKKALHRVPRQTERNTYVKRMGS